MFIFQGVKLRLERVLCKCSPTFCSVECKIKFISRERADYNMLMKLLKPLQHIEYHMDTYYKHSNNEYRPMLIVLRDDYCKSYPSRSSLNALGLLLIAYGNHTNINKPCPWNPGDYYVKDFNLSIKHWPIFVPEGRHKLNFTVYSQAVFVVYFEVYFEVKNHGILDLRVG